MDQMRKAALALSTKAKFVHVCTNGGDGTPDLRVVYNLKRRSRIGALPKAFAGMEEGFSTYIGTNKASRKTEQARLDPRCSLYYEDTRTFEGLAVYGKLESVEDRAVKAALWKKGWEIFYAGGIDGGDFQVFLFVSDRCRYYHGLGVTEFQA